MQYSGSTYRRDTFNDKLYSQFFQSLKYDFSQNFGRLGEDSSVNVQILLFSTGLDDDILDLV